MAKVKATESRPSRRPALTPEAREAQLISAAYDLAEQRIIDGTASSSEVVHFLKLASSKAKLESKYLEAQAEVAIAKKEALQSQKRSEEMFAEAIKAFRNYSGQGDPDEY